VERRVSCRLLIDEDSVCFPSEALGHQDILCSLKGKERLFF